MPTDAEIKRRIEVYKNSIKGNTENAKIYYKSYINTLKKFGDETKKHTINMLYVVNKRNTGVMFHTLVVDGNNTSKLDTKDICENLGEMKALIWLLEE